MVSLVKKYSRIFWHKNEDMSRARVYCIGFEGVGFLAYLIGLFARLLG
jgi:hypothetical protein